MTHECIEERGAGNKVIRWNAYEGDAGQCDVEGGYNHGHF